MSSHWAASALSWWQEAGVDTIVGESPRNWLDSTPRPTAATAEAGPRPLVIPDTLVEFQAWLLESPDLPFAAPGAPRLGPAGDPEAGPMIFIDMPSAADLAAGALLSGEAGALFDRMIGAIQLSRATIYLAPLSPARSPSGAIDAKSAAALAEIARRHIALAAPKAVLLFGDQCAKALLGSAVAGARGRWHVLDGIKTLVTIRPEKLLQQPAMKKLAWEDLQMFKEGLAP